MQGGRRKADKKKRPVIRVVVKCSWSGARLTVPTTTASGDGPPLPPVRGSTTLLDLVLRLESALPPSLFGSAASSATLVCMRKIARQSEWESTTLAQMLDGDDGSAGAVLTLDLGSGSGAAGGGGAQQRRSDPINRAISSAAASLNIKPVVAPAAVTIDRPATANAATIASLPEPMDVSNDASANDAPMAMAPETSRKVMLPEDAWSQVLQSNFDAVTKDCLNTLLKIIDNLLSRPGEPKVRTMRCANAAFERKVGRCKGGYDFLYSIGFSPKHPAAGGLGTTASAAPEFLELTPANESRETLLRGRKVLTQSAVRDLGVDGGDLPPLPKSSASPPLSTPAAPPSAAAALPSNSRGPASEFNVYKAHSHNVQSAAMGAPDPYAEAGASTTERRLQALQSKRDKMERDMQAAVESDRGLVAYHPGSGPAATAATAAAGAGGGGKSDSSLVAARMRRMEEERKKREEGGFTTKAMRDLERIKKAKVYSHAQIRVNFPDGTHLHAKFLPREKVSSVRSVIHSAFRPALASSLQFDLYVAPPRRLLDDAKTLEDEELVPAARVHVSWKTGAPPAGCYLREELFSEGELASTFPDAKSIVTKRSAPAKSNGKGNNRGENGGGDAPSKEELLMQRMLGKKSSLFGGKKNSRGAGQDGANKKGDKPKWFKK